jgi:hypothetical protein
MLAKDAFDRSGGARAHVSQSGLVIHDVRTVLRWPTPRAWPWLALVPLVSRR